MMNQNYERFKKPIEGDAYDSEYDISSPDIISPSIRNLPVINNIVLDLTQAQSIQQIIEPGTGFVIQGYDPASGVEAKKVDAFVNVAINSDLSDATKIFPAKTGRGYNGSFTYLTLSWPAQANTAAHLIIYKSKNKPWFGGSEAT